jgi:NDP-sugar pyrophosphorylase family protein
MLNIVFPLAGSSELFQKAGYFYPKPLIEVKGKLMIECVLENPLKIEPPHRILFIVKEEDCQKHHLDNTLKLAANEVTIIKLKKPTSGAVCSIVMAIDYLNEEDELLILNGDQIIDFDFNEAINYFRVNKADSGIVSFQSIHPRWSYALIENNEVIQTAEKNPISKNAIAGFYYFRNTKQFFEMAFKTVRKNATTDGLFFTSSIINEYILENKKNLMFNLQEGKYFSFYSPQMLVEYENLINKNSAV